MSKDLSAKYYWDKKEKLPKKTSWKISKSFKKIKIKKRQYCCEWYKIFSKNKKQRLVEYRKNILQNEKQCLTIISIVYSLKHFKNRYFFCLGSYFSSNYKKLFLFGKLSFFGNVSEIFWSVKIILLLHRGVYLYEYIHDCEKFNETLLIEKEGFYSHPSIVDVTDADDTHANRICKY